MSAKNDLAAKIVGLRRTDGPPFDQPCELGFHCPVCKYDLASDGEYDERLHWSEYNGFLWCSVCDEDYPSALCMPNIDRAIKLYLMAVRDAVDRQKAKSTSWLERISDVFSKE
jgi:hypothetical protein